MTMGSPNSTASLPPLPPSAWALPRLSHISIAPVSMWMAATTAIRNPQNRSFHITRGYSRDHRPDLNQVILDLMVEHQAGIPIPMKPLSGNSNDARGFGQVVRDHLAQLQITYGTTYVAADSALYSRDTLQQLAKTDMKWITHVPATLSEAQTA